MLRQVGATAGDADVPAPGRPSGRGPVRVGGLVPFSTVDWPGRLVAVCFLAGCPWRCPYCQNAVLRDASLARTEDEVPFAEVEALLRDRVGLLDGVVFSGGEPLAQPGLARAMRRVRDLGFAVGLHTGGALPARLREVLPLVSGVGLDVKAPWDAYERVTGVAGSGDAARESLQAVLEAGVPMEARTTWHPDLLSVADVRAIALDLHARGVRAWAIQAYRTAGTDGSLRDATVYPSDVPAGTAELFDAYEFRRA